MFTGHYSFSFAGKALAGESGDQESERRIPLWLLFLAVQWIDVMWSIFVLLGIEKVRIVPGITASNALDLYYMPYTHSLLGALCWSAAAYMACQLSAGLRGVRTRLILAAAVFSHWILDLIVHRPDLALYDSVGKMGLGLWNYRGAAFALEMGVLLCGAAMLYQTATHKVRLAGFVIFLAALQIFGTFFFPPPTSDHAAAMTALGSYIVLALIAWWVDRGASSRA
ncbi:MAG TPA: hypothetical protein VFQ41_18860 [Candidatus Angelobacter sp.]|nr:hypothetical protein [Candidatus Angelobacter sp.]